MAVNTFLGDPPPRIKQWIIDHGGSSQSFWDELVSKLENQDSLPVVGSSVVVPYKVDPNGSPVDTEWMILGYNKDIPRFVKYKNGNTRVYMDVLPETSLLTAFTGADVYSNKDGSGSVLGKVTATGETSFTYGNNNTYSVPGTITVNGTTYEFCGYNATLQSKYGLAAKYDGILYTYAQFDSQNHNDWKTSEIREWLNGTRAVSTQEWKPQSGDAITGTIIGLLGRLIDADFTGNIIPTVTRTWTYSDLRDGTEDSNGCQHLADRFRLLGEGDVNGSHAKLNDDLYDTSKFTSIFVDDASRVRDCMNENGTDSGSACDWWLRSAGSDYSGFVGCVYSGGRVGNYRADYNFFAVLPACLIG